MLQQTKEQKLFADAMRVDAWLWAYKNQIKLQADIFTLEGHEYQVGIMQEYKKRKQCAMKGAQMALTESFILKDIHGMLMGRYPKGVLYLQPTGDIVTEVAKGRFNPLIADNPQTIGRYVTNTDAANIKRIGNAMLYLRGTRETGKIAGIKKTSPKLKGVPVDKIDFDEFDEMDIDMVLLALERIADSRIAEESYFSTPTLPDYGIDGLYQNSDQRIWMLKCSKCGKYTCLEEEFPDCLFETNGKVIRLCMRCRDREIFPRNGIWDIKYPDREMAGWWISQLNKINSAAVNPGTILEAYRNPPYGRLTEVYNSKLAKGYVEAENRLTIEEILSLCGSKGIASSDFDSCTMGVDVGNNFHVVIGKKHFGKMGEIVHLGVYKEQKELDRLMKLFNVQMCVCDAGPELHLMRQFAKRHQNKVYLCSYHLRQKGVYRWNEESMTVAVNRTESLDASQEEMLMGEIVLPKNCEIVREFAKHLNNTGRKLVEDEAKGTKQYVYVKLNRSRPDHFRHSYNYEKIGRDYFQPNVFSDLDLAGITA